MAKDFYGGSDSSNWCSSASARLLAPEYSLSPVPSLATPVQVRYLLAQSVDFHEFTWFTFPFQISIIEFNSLSSIIRAIIPCTLKFKIILHGTKIVSTDMAPIINCQLPGVQAVVETIE